jgi:hypothetical protein
MTCGSDKRFVVCIANKGYEASLECNKIYVMLVDEQAASDGEMRIVDESGEDYLYPAQWFIPIEIPEIVRESVLRASA